MKTCPFKIKISRDIDAIEDIYICELTRDEINCVGESKCPLIK